MWIKNSEGRVVNSQNVVQMFVSGPALKVIDVQDERSWTMETRQTEAAATALLNKIYIELSKGAAAMDLYEY